MLRHHKAPACVLVEPVHDPGPHFPANPAQRLTVEQKRINQRSRLHPGSRVDSEASRLIYNQQMVVLVKDPNRNIFRCQVNGHRCGFSEKNNVPRVHRIPWPAAFAVTPDVTTPNKALDPGTGKVRLPLRQKNVNSLPGVRWLYFEAFDAGVVHCLLSTVHSLLSTLYSLLSTLYSLLRTPGGLSKLLQQSRGIGCPHQGFAYQSGIDSGGHDAPDILGGADPAFAYDGTGLRDQGCQLFRHSKIEFECGEITIIDSDEGSPGVESPVDFRLIMDFH